MFKIDNQHFRELIEKGVSLADLEKKLRPDSFSDEGFLGKEESLLEAVYDDWRIVDGYGTNHKEIAESLAKAISDTKMPNPGYTIKNLFVTGGLQPCPWPCKRGYKQGNGAFVIYNPEVTSEKDLMRVVASLMGVDEGMIDELKSQYKELGAGKDQELVNTMTERLKRMISNKNTVDLMDRIAVVSELHPHLIGEHYFFEGKESPWRANPEVLIYALGLE